MTTDVAETPTPESQITPAEPAEEVAPSGAEADVTGATGGLTPDGTDTSSAEGTDGSESFNVESLPEWQEAVKAPSEEAKQTEPKLPGESVEEVAYKAEQARAYNYQRILQFGDAEIVKWGEAQNLSPEESRSLWDKNVRPLLNAIHGNNSSYTAQVFNQSVLQSLPPEAAEKFFSRQYRSQAEAMKALHTLGEEVRESQWQEKVSKGEYVSKAQVKKIADAAYLKGRGELEHEGGAAGASSGSNVRGSAGSRDNRNDDAKLMDPNTPVSEIEAILARRGM